MLICLRTFALLTLVIAAIGLPGEAAAQVGGAPGSRYANYVPASGRGTSSPASVSAAMDRLAISPTAPAANQRWAGRFQPIGPAAQQTAGPYSASRYQQLSSRQSAPPQDGAGTRRVSINTLSDHPRSPVTNVAPAYAPAETSGAAQQVSYDAPRRPATIPTAAVSPANGIGEDRYTAERSRSFSQSELSEQQNEQTPSDRFSSRRRFTGQTHTAPAAVVTPAAMMQAEVAPPEQPRYTAPQQQRPRSTAPSQRPSYASASQHPPTRTMNLPTTRPEVEQLRAHYPVASRQPVRQAQFGQNDLNELQEENLPAQPNQPQPFGQPQFNQPPAGEPDFVPPGAQPAQQPVQQPPVQQPRGADPFVDDAPLQGGVPGMGPGGEVQFDVIDHTKELSVSLRRSKLLRTTSDIYRTAVVDPTICDVVQFTPREVAIIGRGQGATHVTFWFKDGEHRPVTVLVKVAPDPEERRRLEDEYKLLQQMLAELFPDSKVRLTPVADKLIVRGQAKDSEEAAQIMAIIRRQATGGQLQGGGGANIANGSAAEVLSALETGRPSGPRLNVINMLRVPGEQQVALRVKIAELNRSAARGFGVDVDAKIDLSSMGTSDLFLQSMLNAAAGGTPNILAQFDGDDINIGIRYLQKHGVIRLLSEPTLVTLSGRPATFVAGGEFAVPTIVGVSGVNAVTTDFRAFGAVISFLPTVIDKDRVRLQVSPEFSQVNSNLEVNGTPGLDVRSVSTTVEMREGQTLAIAGLLDDTMTASKEGDLPLLSKIFGRRDVARNETELIILVTPELVHPMEPEEVPPLPGFDITEPNNMEFFLGGRLEGNPTRNYRSTVWPHLRRRYRAGGPAMISGPFGHGQ